MKIAICDDEKLYRDEVLSIINDYVFLTDAAIFVSEFDSAEALASCEERFDLYLLDYAMPVYTGAELAVKLREKFGDSTVICFLTTYETAAVEVINRNIQAQAFLVKPVDRDELIELLKRFYHQSAVNRIVLKQGKNNVTVYVGDIAYAEAQNKTTVLCVNGKKEEFPYLFNRLLEEYLPESTFFRVHRSYAVNLAHVVGFTKNAVQTDTGDSLPCTRLREFKEALDRFNFDSF